MKYYIGAIGGLGDVIRAYFTSPEWTGLKNFKEKNKDSFIKGIIVSHNQQAKTLVELNPYIDEIIYKYPQREMRDKGWSEERVIKQYSNGAEKLFTESGRQSLYLTPEEQSIVNNIIQAGEYIIIHPFASTKSRTPIPPESYIPTIEKILSCNKNVILLGSSYIKSFGIKETYRKVEELNYSVPGVFNLIGRSNSRINVALIKNAEEVIGAWSAYTITGWIFGIKTTVIVNKDRLEGCCRIHENGRYTKYRQHNKDDKIIIPNYNNLYWRADNA